MFLYCISKQIKFTIGLGFCLIISLKQKGFLYKWLIDQLCMNDSYKNRCDLSASIHFQWSNKCWIISRGESHQTSFNLNSFKAMQSSDQR